MHGAAVAIKPVIGVGDVGRVSDDAIDRAIDRGETVAFNEREFRVVELAEIRAREI